MRVETTHRVVHVRTAVRFVRALLDMLLHVNMTNETFRWLPNAGTVAIRQTESMTKIYLCVSTAALLQLTSTSDPTPQMD